MFARRFLAVALISLLLMLAARADTVVTKDGKSFSGRPVEETEEHLKLRTKYGVLTVPKADIKRRRASTYMVELKDGTKIEGKILGETEKELRLKVGEEEKAVALADLKAVTEKAEPRKPRKLGPRQLVPLYRKARAHWEKKEYAQALEVYARIIASDAGATNALYNTACGHALTGEKAKALDFLKKSVEAGFVNFAHIETDKDLDSLREEAAYKEILAKKAEYIKSASGKAVERITKGLSKRGIDAKKYKKHFDEKRNFIYLHTRSDEDFATVRRGLEEYAEYQWKHLFQNKPAQPLYIVLLSSKDTPRFFGRRAGGVFQPGMNTLFCGDSPAYKLLKTNVIIHEFTHALHFADMAARRQRHPIWLIEGLATLFESSERSPDKVTPRHSGRLRVVQAYLERGRTLPWKTIMGLSHRQYMMVARLTYAQSRYMLFYMYEKGLLKKFYDEYTKDGGYKSDKTAADAYEVVFGKPLAEVENDWKDWIRKQKVPALPYLGVHMEPAGKGKVKIAKLAPGGPAEKAGLKAGDVLVAIAGQAVKNPGDVIGTIGSQKVGDEVEVEVLRGEEEVKVTVKLGARSSLPKKAKPYLGLAARLHEGKVLVREVVKDSPAAKAGLEPGMEVLEVGGKKVATVREFLSAVKKAKVGEKVEIKVKKGEEEKTLTAEIAELPGNK